MRLRNNFRGRGRRGAIAVKSNGAIQNATVGGKTRPLTQAQIARIKALEPIVDKDGNQFFVNEKNKLHRTNGPAVIRPDGTQEWWVNGKKIAEAPAGVTFKDCGLGEKVWRGSKDDNFLVGHYPGRPDHPLADNPYYTPAARFPSIHFGDGTEIYKDDQGILRRTFSPHTGLKADRGETPSMDEIMKQVHAHDSMLAKGEQPNWGPVTSSISGLRVSAPLLRHTNRFDEKVEFHEKIKDGVLQIDGRNDKALGYTPEYGFEPDGLGLVARYGDMQEYHKEAPPVDAEQIKEPREVKVAWQDEPLQAKAGDYVVSSGDEQWPVDKDLFESTYAKNADGKYEKTATIMARPMERDFEVESLEGPVQGKAGDYLVQGTTSGEAWLIKKEDFEKTYVPNMTPEQRIADKRVAYEWDDTIINWRGDGKPNEIYHQKLEGKVVKSAKEGHVKVVAAAELDICNALKKTKSEAVPPPVHVFEDNIPAKEAAKRWPELFKK